MAERKAFPVYFKWFEYLDDLAPDIAYKAIKMLAQVAEGGSLESIGDPAADMMLRILSDTVQRDARKYIETCEKRRQAGSKGGKARTASKTCCTSPDPTVFDKTPVPVAASPSPASAHTPCQQPEQSPKMSMLDAAEKTYQQQVKSPETSTVQNLFAQFWAAYPKKSGIKAAEKEFARLHPSNSLLQQMLDAIAWQRKSWQWTNEHGRFIPSPAKWLRAGHWKDKPNESGSAPSYDLDAYERESIYDTQDSFYDWDACEYQSMYDTMCSDPNSPISVSVA